jgi:DNA-binding transcriptional regulator YhcF (GntR family)
MLSSNGAALMPRPPGLKPIRGFDLAGAGTLAYNYIFSGETRNCGCSARITLAFLYACADRDGACIPSQQLIASATGYSVSCVNTAIKTLKAKGLISVQRQGQARRRKNANAYRIIKGDLRDFSPCPVDIFNCTGLSGQARLVYLYLCRLRYGRKPYPSHRAASAACGLSPVTVRTSLAELEAAGLVHSRAQYRSNGSQRANLYMLCGRMG